MSEKQFVIDHSYLVNYDKYCILDKVQHKHLYINEVVDLLNEQDKIIKNQEQRIKILQQEIQSAQQIGTLLSERLKGFCGDGV